MTDIGTGKLKYQIFTQKPDPKEHKYPGFACPQEGLDERFMHAVTIIYGRKCIRRFLEQYGMTLENQGHGLNDYLCDLQECLTDKADFETVWDLSFGNVLACLHARVVDPAIIMRRAAELALRLHHSEPGGHWQANLVAPARLRFGSCVLPLADRLEVDGQGNLLSIKLGLSGQYRELIFQHSPDGWKTEDVSLEYFKHVETCPNRIALVPTSVFKSDELECSAIGSPEITLAMNGTVRAALEIIAENSPIYLPWIQRVTRALIPLEVEGALVSGGINIRPGVIHMSLNAAPVVIAELLVHEATHQYMYLLRRTGPLDDGSDSTLYYSPIKQTGRPISAICLAYHAFANIILFYRLCRASGLQDGGYCQKSEENLLPHVYTLETALRTTDALTAQGRALWEPLAWRLREDQAYDPARS